MTFGRQRHAEKEIFEIEPLIIEALDLLRASIPVSIKIDYQGCPEPLLLNADPTQIHQIIMNLVTNAYHAIGETSGRIVIATTAVSLGPDKGALHPDMVPGRYLKLIIADTGCGIEQQNLDRIFEPYFTTKEVDVGTGMGLATVHGIIQEHGGGIGVESRPGEGTIFFVHLPLTEVRTDSGSVDPTALPAGHERILFVDDEKMLVESARDFLEELGYRADCETDPRTALTRFASEPTTFDLVITDLTMPSMTGAELAREIRKIRPDLPIIICSGLSKKLTDGNLADIGLAAILNKPIVFDEFARAIRTVLDEQV
jgi:CheY-like chemotaxis protein